MKIGVLRTLGRTSSTGLSQVELELPEGVTAEAGLPIDQEMLCPIQNLPEGLELDTAVVVFKARCMGWPGIPPPSYGAGNPTNAFTSVCKLNSRSNSDQDQFTSPGAQNVQSTPLSVHLCLVH